MDKFMEVECSHRDENVDTTESSPTLEDERQRHFSSFRRFNLCSFEDDWRFEDALDNLGEAIHRDGRIPSLSTSNENLWELLPPFERLMMLVNHESPMETEEDSFEAGLSDEELSRIKKVNLELTSQCCAVCLNSFGSDEVSRNLPCRHIFHDKCIVPWLKTCKTCPTCRTDVSQGL